jgi:acyl-ACP thioesterase
MYSFNSRVRYSEMNHNKQILDASSIINYFQDCSTFQSESLNRGVSYTLTNNKIWLLSSWQLQILKPAHLGDFVTIGTWPYAFKGFYGYRNFILKDDLDNVLAIADSIWTYYDPEAGKPIKVLKDSTGYTLEPPYPMEHMDRKIKIPKQVLAGPSFPVVKSNIDSYHHVNNGQYVKMAEEFLPDNFFISCMRVEYRMQAILGDIIVPLISKQIDCYTIILADVSEKPYAIVEFYGKSIVSEQSIL